MTIGISKTFFLSSFIIASVSTLVISLSWINYQEQQLDAEIQDLRNDHEQAYENILREETALIVSYIQYIRSRSEVLLMTRIRDRVGEAWQVIDHYYQSYHDNHTRDEIIKLIRDALYPVAYDDGMGYYFCVGLDGYLFFAGGSPDEGSNCMDKQDGQGRHFVRNAIEIASEKGEGFTNYSFNKPGQWDREFEKLAFVKVYEPLGIVVGTGLYYDDFEKQLQQDVIDHIGSFRFENDCYVFAGQYDGVSLIGPAKGQNMIAVTDKNGLKVVLELIRKAQTGGGMVRYVMPDVDGQPQLPKMSYVQPVSEWNWYIGTGIFIQDIDSVIKKKRQQLQEEMKQQLNRIFALYAAVNIFVLIITGVLSRMTASSVNRLSEFFHRASSDPGSVMIEPDKLYYREFSELAGSARHMVDQRLNVEKEREKLINDLEIKNAELERFVYTVSHDLKSPLVTVGGGLGLLKEDLTTGDMENVDKDMEMIKNAAEKMHRLLNELLELSRVGRKDNPREAFFLRDVIEEVILLMEKQLVDRNIALTIEEDLPQVYADRIRIVEVFQNLIDNAIKYMGDRKEGKICIGAKRTENECVVFVKDNGIGIEPRYHDRIFGLFEQLDPQQEGTGVGLAICKRIIEIHRGRIWIESDGPGRGTTFYFSLPRHDN